MKALVTGCNGFVGQYMIKELQDNGYETVGIDVKDGENSIQLDLLDFEKTRAAIARISPNIVIHLAGQANVARSWIIPQKTFE